MSGECADLIENMVDPTIEPSLEVTRHAGLAAWSGGAEMLLLLQPEKVPDVGGGPPATDATNATEDEISE